MIFPSWVSARRGDGGRLVRPVAGSNSIHFWLSEQGVELTNGEDETTKLEEPYPVPGTKKVITKFQRQAAAARDFLQLANSDPRIDLVDYYLYRGPTEKEN